jgi:septum formation protein
VNDTPPPPKLYLASASPRRADLLRQAGYAFAQHDPPFDDTHKLVTMPADKAAPALAFCKANSFASTIDEGLVIGCDTIVSVDGLPLGKPQDVVEARKMLAMLINNTHTVISAVCLIDATTHRQHTFADSTEVTLGHVDDQRLVKYLYSNAWAGKAGAYNLAELEHWPFTIEGDPTTVIGLPMIALTRELHNFEPALPHPESAC